MTRYYKATRMDGTDFRTGTINYADALVSGEVIRHPATLVEGDASTYLSVSVDPAQCIGMEWPCRLFLVENAGPEAITSARFSFKRCLSALRVVEEVPAEAVFGPDGQEALDAELTAIEKMVDAAVKITKSEDRQAMGIEIYCKIKNLKSVALRDRLQNVSTRALRDLFGVTEGEKS